MKRTTTFAVCIATALLLSTGVSLAIDINAPFIDVPPPPDYTPIDVPPPPDYTPIDVPPPPNPEDAIIDAILDGVDDPGLDDAGDTDADGPFLLNCVVKGGDLIITNAGDAIPAGAKVKWSAAGQHATVLLPNGLRPGQKAKIDAGLGVESGKCTADVVL